MKTKFLFIALLFLITKIELFPTYNISKNLSLCDSSNVEVIHEKQDTIIYTKKIRKKMDSLFRGKVEIILGSGFGKERLKVYIDNYKVMEGVYITTPVGAAAQKTVYLDSVKETKYLKLFDYYYRERCSCVYFDSKYKWIMIHKLPLGKWAIVYTNNWPLME